MNGIVELTGSGGKCCGGGFDVSGELWGRGIGWGTELDGAC